MRHVTVNFIRFAGAGEGEAALRRATCLVENARHLRRDGRGDGAWLDIVLLGDVEALSPAVRAELERPPCRLHDGRAAYAELVDRHPRLLERFAGPYGVIGYALLRWTLIARLFPGEPLLCYDGDILHNVPLRDLERAFAGLTTTATSTCFAAISDPRWFSAWEEAVLALEDDPGRFDRLMQGALSGTGASPQLSAEEFLAKVLIEDGTLRQDPLPADFPYWIVPNPHALPRLYCYVRPRGAPERIDMPMRYERRRGIDHVGGRPVAFWHMQKPFLNQLGVLSTLEAADPAHHPGRVPVLSFYGRFPYDALVRAVDPYHDEFPMPLPAPRLRPLARTMIAAELRHWEDGTPVDRNPFSAAAIYRRYFEEGDLGLLFNDRTWPEPGIWT
ncbi:hypothetical protein STAQ_31060 [Allostella sp. ATCC 35155]|nr:hypothetical protein STAQ_31060 [Stella sp. ATCC 35155]